MKIGVDLGGSHISVGIINDEGKLIAKEEENILLINRGQNEIKELITNKIIEMSNFLKQKLQIPAFIIDEIGVGVPGIIENNNIKKCEKYGIYDWDLAKDLQFTTNSPSPCRIKLTNDALAATRAEVAYGNLKDANKAVFLCIGTGIGGAIIIPKNSVFSSNSNSNSNSKNEICVSTSHEIYSSEFGHMVIEKSGRLCHCGRRGCFETYCSMRAFKNGIIELLDLSKNNTSEQLHSILKSKITNEELNNYIDNYVENLALGISNIINITNPQKICIGGSFTFFEDFLFDRLVTRIQNCNLQFEVPKIVLSMFQNNGGIIGAVL